MGAFEIKYGDGKAFKNRFQGNGIFVLSNCGIYLGNQKQVINTRFNQKNVVKFCLNTVSEIFLKF